MLPILEIVSESVPGPEKTTPNTSTYTVSDQLSGNQSAILQSLRQQIMQNQVVVASRNVEDRGQEIPIDHPQPEVSQAPAALPNNGLPPPFQPEENNQADQLRDEQNFNAYDYGLGNISPLDDLHLSPGIMNCLDFGAPDMPFSIPCFDNGKSGSPPMAFSVEQLRRIRRLWPRQRSQPGVRLIQKLWRQVVHPEADNIFSEPQASSHDSIHPATRSYQTSRWNMDDECRNGLAQYCKELDDVDCRDESNDTGLRLTPLRSVSEERLEKSPPVSDGDFPTAEVLDSSLDFSFQFFQPNLPFIHKLLSMQERLDVQNPRFFGMDPRTLIFLHSRSLNLVDTVQDEVDECQAHMLCAKMLYIAEKHGLFAADHGDDLALQLHCAPSDPEGS
ncbi:hypothetical protein K469DRAFT_749140 [Zopfia rhizophila CBS 207.26]|uniref:Uncharacterized protein n=1 Tax=Zopfia rhizophila CBS 207.26 TaxID=1314779 RepID=A0A6A6E882_9PEZI|nr:hypothetical protein K469DRAFT_749140 [Zopfia rhizophila CBS 207.26]